MCSHAVQQQLPITQLDIASAYLYGDIDTVIYMKQPPGFIGQENHVCKLLKSIYGLNQSGFIWHNLLKNTILKDSNYSQSSLDPCLFYADNRNFILIYVDDILLVGSNSAMRNKIQNKFTTHDLGNIQQFLNVKFERTEHSISISQENFILQLLKSYNLQDINPKKTPMLKLELDESPFLPDNLKYTQLVGSLIYLTTVSRPDIAYCVIYLARQSSKPTERNWNQLKHLLAYLKSTAKIGINFSEGNGSKLSAFCDSDYAGDLKTGRSTSGIIVQHGTNLISWKSSLQSRVALSSFEAEYYALAEVTKEIIYFTQLLKELKITNQQPTLISIDNQSAIVVANSPLAKFNPKSKHINTKFHFIKTEINDGKVKLIHVPSNENLADILTKVLPLPAFTRLSSYLKGG